MSTKDLVNAIIAGDAVEIETVFNDTMAEKISVQLDAMRQEVAQNMFKTEQTVEEAVSHDSKARYEFANGKKPSGDGNWMFTSVHPREHDIEKHKDQTVSVRGKFSDASREAAKQLKAKGHKGEIHVLS